MTLTRHDLAAIKQLITETIDTRVPKIIDERVAKIVDARLHAMIDERIPAIIDDRIPRVMQPLLDRLERRLTVKVDQLTLDVGQFSLETTNNFMAFDAHLEDLDDGLAKLYEMADNNGVELRKLKHKLGTT